MFQQLRTALQDDYLAIAGLVAGAGQIGLVLTLFDLETSNMRVYGTSLTAITIMIFFALKHRNKAYRERFHELQSRTHSKLAALYIVLSLVAASPAAYRYIYINTTWLTPSDAPSLAPIPIGWNFGDLFFASALAADSTITTHASLDTSRTSVRCAVPSAEVFEWSKCKEFRIPKEAAERFEWGWKAHSTSGYERRLQFEKKYFTDIISPTRRALRSIPRLAKNPLFSDFEALIMFPNDLKWKQRLISEQLLPTAGEWATLNKSLPEEARALRRYLTELIGILDPLFAVSIENKSNMPVEITTITYTATYQDTAAADLLSGYERPRYILELQDGTHTEPLNHPLVVPSKGIAAFDLLLTLKSPRPGSLYDVDIAFGTHSDIRAASLPKTKFMFLKGKDR